jgi:hypothetical protein
MGQAEALDRGTNIRLAAQSHDWRQANPVKASRSGSRRVYSQRVIIGRKVVVARKYLARGYSLNLAAQAAAITASTLDLYLWRCLGMNDTEVVYGRWLKLEPQP